MPLAAARSIASTGRGHRPCGIADLVTVEMLSHCPSIIYGYGEQSARINPHLRSVLGICVRVNPPVQSNRVALNVTAKRWIINAGRVVIQTCFGIVILARETQIERKNAQAARILIRCSLSEWMTFPAPHDIRVAAPC